MHIKTYFRSNLPIDIYDILDVGSKVKLVNVKISWNNKKVTKAPTLFFTHFPYGIYNNPYKFYINSANQMYMYK